MEIMKTIVKRKQIWVVLLLVAFTAIFYAFIPVSMPTKTFVLVLDAGHGGKDPGNLGTGRLKKTEKDVTLDVVLAVGQMIEKKYPEVKVVYTRNGDTFPTLKDRVNIANRNKADLFISVHCNANANSGAFGSESFVMGLHKTEESLATAMKENASIFLEDNQGKDYDGFDPNNPVTYIALSLRENVFLEQSADLAKHVQDFFKTQLGRKDRGVKQAGYYVISFTNMPSILIELGFLTNPTEEDYLQSTSGKTALSKGIFTAFDKYFQGMKQGKSAREVAQEQEEKGKESEKESGKESGKENESGDKVLEPLNASESTQSEEIDGVMWRQGDEKGIWFKVQVHTSPQLLKENANDFKGLKRVDHYIYGGQYKYTVGRSQSFNEAKLGMKAMQSRGFTDAFIVAFENGTRIDLKEALKKVK
jgi:N-acetylmuramoyl-L-alanine amidase